MVGRPLVLLTTVDDVEITVRADSQRKGPPEVRVIPRATEIPFAVDDLDSRVGAIRNVDSAFSVKGNAMWQIEFTEVGPFTAPFPQKPSVRCETGDAAVPVAVANVDGAIGGHRNVGWFVEMRSIAAWFAVCAQRHQEV